MLGDSAVVVRTHPRAIPLAKITTRKSTHGFPFLSYMSMGLRLAALWTAGAPQLTEADQECPSYSPILPTISKTKP